MADAALRDVNHGHYEQKSPERLPFEPPGHHTGVTA
jgi:hypothetical protein